MIVGRILLHNGQKAQGGGVQSFIADSSSLGYAARKIFESLIFEFNPRVESAYLG